MKTLLQMLLMGTLLFNSCSTEKPTTAQSSAVDFKVAQSEFALGNYEDALTAVQDAIKLDSVPIEYHELLGKILWELGDTLHSNEQAELAMSAMQQNNVDHNAVESLIDWELSHQNKEEARKLLEKDLELYKDDTIAHQHLTNYAFHKYLELGDTAAAIGLLQSNLKKFPEHPAPYKLLADLDFKLKEYRSARKNYGKYVEMNATDADALFHLGVCYLDAKNKSKAKKYFEKASNLGHSQACKNYRELSAKTRYSIRSVCCDGSYSSSTGRGTCSHHGGVCRTEHVPYKTYTVNCN